jgi:hypothetical protein
MTVILDFVMGAIIGGFLLLIGLTATESGTRTFYNYNADAIVQMNLTNTSNTIQYDLRKMGYGVPEALQGTIVQVAQPNHFKYLTHLNMDADCNLSSQGPTFVDNIVDTIDYTISALQNFTFPDTTITIYQVQRTISIVGESPQSIMIGTIGNSDVFRYLNQIGEPAPIQQAIKMVEVTLTAFDPQIVLSPDMFTGGDTPEEIEFRAQELRRLLRASYWRQTRLISRNLRR